MQETHSTLCDIRRWKNEWGGNIWFDHGSWEKGVAILTRKNFPLQIFEAYRLEEYPGRFLAVKAKIENETVSISEYLCPE